MGEVSSAMQLILHVAMCYSSMCDDVCIINDGYCIHVHVCICVYGVTMVSQPQLIANNNLSGIQCIHLRVSVSGKL